jgi:hypothetical protein
MTSKDNKLMKILLIIFLLSLQISQAAFVGISTHPLNDNAKVLSAEFTGFMSQRHEVGMGARYTQEVMNGRILDLGVMGAQNSRSLMVNSSLDFKILDEDIYRPRFSLRPYLGYSKVEENVQNLVGLAPVIRKGFSLNQVEFFPYISIPTGLKINSSNDEFNFSTSLTLGSSFNFPGADSENLLMSVEGNKDLGSSSDYLTCMVSWVWD